MNLNNYKNRHDLLIDWILETVPKGSRILDIGANDGSFCPEVARIATHAAFFAGVDPDSRKLVRHPLLQERYPSTMEEANIPPQSFDCAYTIYVFEHVRDENAFLQAASRALKPGGSLFFITPNGYQYFAVIASTLARLGLQDKVLRMIVPAQQVDAYHYPALYRLNRPAGLRELGRKNGFERCEFRFTEKLAEFACYFPGPLKVFPWLWERMVEMTGKEQLLGNLLGRMIKPQA
jgi:ubiquinone/menaquinone biosynthesis C-methylase UbiE